MRSPTHNTFFWAFFFGSEGAVAIQAGEAAQCALKKNVPPLTAETRTATQQLPSCNKFLRLATGCRGRRAAATRHVLLVRGGALARRNPACGSLQPLSTDYQPTPMKR
jgi:hypothetical protein